jgi:hypothetical protein
MRARGADDRIAAAARHLSQASGDRALQDAQDAYEHALEDAASSDIRRVDCGTGPNIDLLVDRNIDHYLSDCDSTSACEEKDLRKNCAPLQKRVEDVENCPARQA